MVTNWVRKQEIRIESSRRSVDSMQDSAWEAAETEEAERKPARTSETIPVPAPNSTRGRTKSIENLLM